MIILDATTKSLEAKLSGAPATNQLPIVASYVDLTSTTYTPGESDTVTNSGTAVTALAAPGASTQRQLKSLCIRNRDTASVTLTIQYNNNATIRELWTGTLAVDDTLFYEEGDGFYALDSTGGRKGAGTGGSYTDEQAQDAVGAMIGDTATVDLVYVDATPAFTANVIPGGIKLDDLGTPDDNTDLNVSTTVHGLAPKISGSDGYVLTKSGTAAVWSAAAGGATDAKYVVQAAHASLSAELVHPYVGNYNPDIPPASPSGTDDEFDDDSIAGGWTDYGTPDTVSETTYHGFLYMRDNDTTVCGKYIAYAPGAAALTVVAKVHYDVSLHINNFAGIALMDSGGGTLGVLGINGGNVGASDDTTKFRTGNNGATVPPATYSKAGRVYLMLQRDATTNYVALASADGMFFKTIATWSQAGTIDRCGLEVYGQGTNTDGAFDFVRMFTSQTTVIGRVP